MSTQDLQGLVRNELCTSSSSLVGFRQMTEIINSKYNLNVSKENVQLALLEVDPQGVEDRRGKTINQRNYYTDGPGDFYHIDGNDKLKKWALQSMVVLMVSVKKFFGWLLQQPITTHLLLAIYSSIVEDSMVLLQGFLKWIMGLKIPIVKICNLSSPMTKIVTLIVSQSEISILRLFGQE